MDERAGERTTDRKLRFLISDIFFSLRNHLLSSTATTVRVQHVNDGGGGVDGSGTERERRQAMTTTSDDDGPRNPTHVRIGGAFGSGDNDRN